MFVKGPLMAQSRHAQCADECPLLKADIDNRCLPISICEHTARSNGESVHLADLKGKMVVLEWTNDGCQRCRAPGALLESDLLISQRFDCSVETFPEDSAWVARRVAAHFDCVESPQGRGGRVIAVQVKLGGQR